MILLGTEHWTTTHPVWPLLQSLAADHGYRDLITLTDDERVAIEHIERYERREAGVG
jgi:hypothetical protein